MNRQANHRTRRGLRAPIALAVAFLASAAPAASAQDLLTGRFGTEVRGFARGPAHEGQDRHAGSVFLEPEFFVDWADGAQRLVVSPFLRVDAGDARRTHADLREAYWQWYGSTMEVRAGFGRVFWGVTESRHLVDVVNQTDGIEGPDGEAKLGQPMVQFTWLPDFGTVDLIVMPFFREPSFPGSDGRLRAPLPIASDRGIRHERVDLAARYAHYVGSLDFGLSGFWGTSREPLFRFDPSAGGLSARYPTIGQVGLDAQWTRGPWLAKLETLFRTGYGGDFAAVTTGVEYTLSNVKGSGLDIGLLTEFHLDGRDDTQLGDDRVRSSPFNDDLFGGVRLALNDVQSTTLLTGAIVDRDTGETSLFLEASRRLGDRMTAELEVRSFHHTDPSSPLHFLRDDSYAQIELSYFF